MTTTDTKPEVLFLTAEAIAVAQGDAMTMRLSTGEDVVCRLATPEEYLKIQAEAAAKLGLDDLPKPSMADAVRVTQALPSRG